MTLFPRKIFNDTLPQIVLKHQLYSMHSDKTLVDKEVVRRLFMSQKDCIILSKCGDSTHNHSFGSQNKLREQGELLMFQLGFDAEAFGLVFTSDYKAKVLSGVEGKATQATVEKFLEKVLSSSTDLSFSKDKMLKEFFFTDSEIT